MIFSDPSWITTFLVFVLTFLVVYVTTKRPVGIPPGPPLLPIIGNLHYMAIGDLLPNLRKLRDVYGDIFSLYLGNELMIFLNGHTVIHEALVKQGSKFTGRPMSEFHRMWVKVPGIIFATGVGWKEQRRAASEIFQNICFKDKSRVIEEVVLMEADKLTKILTTTDKPVNLDDFITISVCNVICQVVFSKRYEFDDPIILNYLTEVKQGAKLFMIAQTLSNCFPFLQKLPFDLIKVDRVRGMDDKMRAFMLSHVMNAKQSPDNSRGNFVDLYLAMVDEEQNQITSIDEQHLLSVLIDLFAAGTETTANTLRWIVLYLVRKQEIQQRLHQEITLAIGNRPPTLADRPKMPYTQAVILEGLRIAPPVPLGVPRTVSRDLDFHGYRLPENCSIMVNINSALMDPSAWKDPDEFQPERFLNDTEDKIVVPPEFVPFSTGPRSCIGETFSRLELFLFVSTLFQQFQFLSESDVTLPKVKGQMGVSYSPPDFKVRVRKRN